MNKKTFSIRVSGFDVLQFNNKLSELYSVLYPRKTSGSKNSRCDKN